MIKHHDIACFYFVIFSWETALPLGPFTSFTSIIFSVTAFLLLTYSLTMQPASFSASTALLWVTSLTSTSFTRSIQSLTLYREKEGEHWLNSPNKDINNNDKVFFEVQSLKTVNWCVNKWSIIQATCKRSSSATATKVALCFHTE